MMKKSLFLVVFALAFASVNLFSQENSSIESAFQKSNAAILLSQLSDEVAYINGAVNDSHSKSEMVSILNRFMRANVPTEFSIIHEGARGDTRFVICSLTSARANYRIHFLYKKINNQYLITQVRIEQSNG